MTLNEAGPFSEPGMLGVESMEPKVSSSCQ